MDGHVFSPVVKFILRTVPTNKFLLWIIKIVDYHAVIGEENTSLITHRTISHIQNKFIMFSPLFCIYCWCCSQWISLQAGLRHQISYQSSAVLRKITFFHSHYWSVVILLMVRVIKSSYRIEFFRLRPPSFVLYFVFAVIIVHMPVLCTQHIRTTA